MDATLVGADEGTDIAVLQFNEPAPEGATPVPLGDSDALQIGELAIVIGNPGSGTEVLFGTVTAASSPVWSAKACPRRVASTVPFPPFRWTRPSTPATPAARF